MSSHLHSSYHINSKRIFGKEATNYGAWVPKAMMTSCGIAVAVLAVMTVIFAVLQMTVFAAAGARSDLAVAAVAAGAAGGKRVVPDKFRCAAGLGHRVVEVAQGGREIVEPKLFHQLTDAAGREARFKAGAVGIGEIVHVPGIRVPVRGAKLRSFFHG